MKVKQAKKAEYVRIKLSNLVTAFEKTLKVYLPTYEYGDEVHIFEGVKPLKKVQGFTMEQIKLDANAREEVFGRLQEAHSLSSHIVDWLLAIAVGSGMVVGKNFIVDMQE